MDWKIKEIKAVIELKIDKFADLHQNTADLQGFFGENQTGGAPFYLQYPRIFHRCIPSTFLQNQISK